VHVILLEDFFGMAARLAAALDSAMGGTPLSARFDEKVNISHACAVIGRENAERANRTVPAEIVNRR
jgi:hypothetical protein